MLTGLLSYYPDKDDWMEKTSSALDDFITENFEEVLETASEEDEFESLTENLQSLSDFYELDFSKQSESNYDDYHEDEVDYVRGSWMVKHQDNSSPSNEIIDMFDSLK